MNNIFLSGFNSYEGSKLAVFFELAEKRAPHWRQTTLLNDADVVLLNALTLKDVEDLSLRISAEQKVIIVGESNFGKDWTVLSRPFKLVAILELLDKFCLAKTDALPQNIGTPLAQVSAIRPITVPKRLSPSHLISDIVAKELAKKIQDSVATKETVIGRVLLVDDSDIALKYMQNRLRQFSYECELVSSGEEALVKLQTQNYHFVFLDVTMTGLDGYQTCKIIKNNKTRRGPAPVVVMLTSRGGTIDKIRGAMSGCDAYLTKPLNDKKLNEVLAKFDISTIAQRWEAAHPYQPLVDAHVKTSNH